MDKGSKESFKEGVNMLSPDYLQKITELTEQKVSEVNEYLTAKIIKRIIKLFEETGEVKVIPSSLLDLKKQQYAGRLLDEIQIEVEQQLPEIRNEIRRAFYDAGAKIANDVNATTGEILRTVHRNGDLTDVSMPEFENKQKASKLSDLNMTEKEISCLESAYRRTQGELYNLTKTSANSAKQTFIKACDTAYFKVTHGTSLDTAIVEAIKEVSERGITTIHYASGYEDKLEVAIARAVRTGVNQANGDITLTRCAEAGVNYVITSSHIGARVTPYADYRTHADWQGQVYVLNWSRSELSQYETQPHEAPKGRFAFLNDMKEFFQKQQNKKYKDFIDTCGYGKMLGICGINCRHSFGLFYPGISINNQIQYDSEENKKRYQQEQKQRAMERNIRLIKRELNGLDSSGLDAEEAKMRKQELKELLQIKDAEYKKYCQKNGLKPLNYRLQVAKMEGVHNEDVVNLAKDDTIVKTKEEKVIEVHSVGKIDKEIYKCITEDIVTDEVIITDERIQHIKDRHPNDYERYCEYLTQIVESPDYIVETNKPNTALVLKEFFDGEEQFKTVVRLTTSCDNPNFKNSIITFMKINDKEWRRLLRNKQILYKKE